MIRVFQIALLSSLAFWTAGCNSTKEKPIWKQVKIGEDYDGSDGWQINWQDYTGTYRQGNGQHWCDDDLTSSENYGDRCAPEVVTSKQFFALNNLIEIIFVD